MKPFEPILMHALVNDAHTRDIKTLCGISKRGIYDNMMTTRGIVG